MFVHHDPSQCDCELKWKIESVCHHDSPAARLRRSQTQICNFKLKLAGANLIFPSSRTDFFHSNLKAIFQGLGLRV